MLISSKNIRRLVKRVLKTAICVCLLAILYFVVGHTVGFTMESMDIRDIGLRISNLKTGLVTRINNIKDKNISELVGVSSDVSYKSGNSMSFRVKNQRKKLKRKKKINGWKENRKKKCFGKPRSGYCILEVDYKAENTTGFNNSVTLTTQATTGFEYHVEELCRRWQGPVSVAIYAPGDDLKSALENIEYLRRCGHECVRQWVTWHFLYDQMHPPESSLLKLSLNLMKKKVSSHSKNQLFSINCKSKPLSKGETYVRLNNLPYPINVARNVARLNAKTHYVFASDVELYPSENIIPRFLRLVESMKNGSSNFTTKRQVFVLPVFEVRSGIQPPTRKEDLRALIKRKDAISFHQYVCDVCHRIPDLHRWLKTYGSRESLKIFISTKRKYRGSYVGWEPFFIGTNQDPLFDERLTWNGRKNKMQVAHELCFLNYDLHILDDAFLVHASGIKYFNSSFVRMNRPFVATNRRVLIQDLRLLREKYKTDSC
ncbi:beta-1,4-glucuronyltransferase 1-like [Tachypleus tridentatus]|uniref:beta-1,4-glucuronyltransferase 1-like n=1 Tax=Tachypleus tridentatus TaxID=6853 RepID=UPI003FD61419